jgi:hypothetical protein
MWGKMGASELFLICMASALQIVGRIDTQVGLGTE